MASYRTYRVASSTSEPGDFSQPRLQRRFVRDLGMTSAAREEAIRLFQTQDGGYWMFFQNKDGRHLFSKEQDELGIWSLADAISTALYNAIDDLIAWTRLYGVIAGPVVAIFGNKSVWTLQAEVLASSVGGGIPPLRFKEIMEKESSRIGISGTVITQIAITSLSLESLSQTHWVARASWLFSLMSGLLAVYYAGNPVWKIGRLEGDNQIRAWIRSSDKGIKDILAEPKTLSEKTRLQRLIRTLAPAPSSVLVVTAPGLLLSSALVSLLVGFGIYFYFVWARRLDSLAGRNDSRDTFIFYIVSLLLCYGVYAIAGISQDKETTATVRETIRGALLRILLPEEEQQPSPPREEPNQSILRPGSLSTLELGRDLLLGGSPRGTSDVQIECDRTQCKKKQEEQEEQEAQERKKLRKEQRQKEYQELLEQLEREKQQERKDWEKVQQWVHGQGIQMFEMDNTDPFDVPLTDEMAVQSEEQLAADEEWRFRVRWTFVRVVAADAPDDVLASMTALFLTYLERHSLRDKIQQRAVTALKIVISSGDDRWRKVEGLQEQVVEVVKRIRVMEQRSVLDRIERLTESTSDNWLPVKDHTLQEPIVEAFEAMIVRELRVQVVEILKRMSDV